MVKQDHELGYLLDTIDGGTAHHGSFEETHCCGWGGLVVVCLLGMNFRGVLVCCVFGDPLECFTSSDDEMKFSLSVCSSLGFIQSCQE